MIEKGLVDKVISLVPRNSIKLGFADDCKVVPIAESRRLLRREHIHIDVDLKSDYKDLLRNAHGAVITYHSLPRFLEYFRMLTEAGKKLMFVFDEVHHGAAGEFDDDLDATANVWGDAIQQVREFAHAMICMTGTPVRTDRKRVALFEYEPKQIFNPLGGGMTPALQVRANFEFNYPDAVRAGVARKLIIRNQNPTIDYEEDGFSYSGKLTGIKTQYLPLAKRLLSDSVKGTIDDMLRAARSENERHRHIGDKDAAILVIVENGGPGKQNPLMFVADRIRTLFQEEPVTVESADGAEAPDQIKAFKKAGNARRWLVAKNMISEGTNIPRIRVICILRDIKSDVFYKQLVHRATRNDSDEVPQDAIVIQWQLPSLYQFGCAIEEETRLVVQMPKPVCPRCNAELEFRPHVGMPCPVCGYEPGESAGGGGGIDWFGRAARFDDEEVRQGGEDFSEWDPKARRILDHLGEQPHYGGRHGINEVLRAFDQLNLMEAPTARPETPIWSVDEEMDQFWRRGMENCKKAAGIISRKTDTSYEAAVPQVVNRCKREAGMGQSQVEKVRREDPDARGKIKKFYIAAERALTGAKKMGESGGHLPGLDL